MALHLFHNLISPLSLNRGASHQCYTTRPSCVCPWPCLVFSPIYNSQCFMGLSGTSLLLVHPTLTEYSPYTYTELMAWNGHINICIICKEYPNWLGVNSLGYPSFGSECAGWLFYCPLVIKQHRWETLPKWLPMNSLFLGSP